MKDNKTDWGWSPWSSGLYVYKKLCYYFYVFLRFFKIEKIVTFYVSLPCFVRFLELWFAICYLGGPYVTAVAWPCIYLLLSYARFGVQFYVVLLFCVLFYILFRFILKFLVKVLLKRTNTLHDSFFYRDSFQFDSCLTEYSVMHACDCCCLLSSLCLLKTEH